MSPLSALHARRQLAVITPAWQPEAALVELIAALSDAGFGAVLVVDDGSASERQTVFDEIAQFKIQILRHAVNLGKGRALKTAFNSVLTEHPEIQAVLTADADGQHTVQGILAVADAFCANPKRPVLGVRTFGSDVPLRNRFGNLLTRRIFAFVTGTKLADTQTGLRVFPRFLLPELMVLDGERYEYEMTVLAYICQHGHSPTEVPIQTVYIENNRSSHFDPVRDSMRIYFVLLRFYLSSIIAAAIDFAGFTIAFALTGNVLASVAVGRLSSLVNFALNKKFVFHARTTIGRSIWRYYLLVIAVGILSYGCILALKNYAHWNIFAAKVVVDVLLSLVSFSVQRTFVFRRGKEV
jgi:glycosyltransferase involved in cell wall biosynthesis